MPSTEVAVLIALRLLVPLSILRWPFWGFMASILMDAIDRVSAIVAGNGSMALDGLDYTQTDKLLDTYYMSLAAATTLPWQNRMARNWVLGLHGWRIVGVVLLFPPFDQPASILIVFASLGEFWFMFWMHRLRYFPTWQLTNRRLAIVLLVLLVPKLLQEVFLHYQNGILWDPYQDRMPIRR